MHTSRRFRRHLVPLLGLAACARPGTPAARPAAVVATDPAGDADPVAAQRRWWQALVRGDTAGLGALSAPGLTLTYSGGRTVDRAGALADAVSYAPDGSRPVRWTDEAVTSLAGGRAAVVAGVLHEPEGARLAAYRYLAVLERDASDRWRVVAAQSTRPVEAAARVPLAVAGSLASYAGRYLASGGAVLAVSVRDSGLALTVPGGAVQRLDPVGPGLFEIPLGARDNAVIRLAFARDDAGRVTSMSRIARDGVRTFARAAEP